MQAGVDLQQHDRPGPQHLILIGMLKQAVLPEAPGPGRVVQSVGFATRLIHALYVVDPCERGRPSCAGIIRSLERHCERPSSGTVGVGQAWFFRLHRESRT